VTNIEWVACIASTGEVIMDLRHVVVSEFSDVMNGYATTTAMLPVTDLPDGWEQATREMATTWVQLDDGVPVAGGLVVKTDVSRMDAIHVSLATIPYYFRGRYVGDELFTAVDQCEIAATLADTYAADSLALDVVFEPSATTRDRTYADIDDKVLLSALTELAAVDGGPEWCVYWSETLVGDRRAYVPVFYVADRLGSSPIVGLEPDVVFELGLNVLEFSYSRDYTAGAGANDVMAVSTGFDTERPQSAHQVAATDRLTWERRFTPSTSITSVDRLNEHATANLARVKDGVQTLDVTLVSGSEITAGVDFAIGDVVGFRHAAPALAGVVSGTARVYGVKRSYVGTPTVTPTLGDVTFLGGF